MRWVLCAEDREPAPGSLAEVPSTLMSDTLVELMEPYISWPPARDELDDLDEWLQLGAAVWNVTVTAEDGSTCVGELARLASELELASSLDVVEAIARRKFSMFSADQRRIAAVRVVTRDGRVMVEAATYMSVPGVSR